MSDKNKLMVSDDWSVKWRPRRFSDLIGQDDALTIMRGSIKQRSIPKALLFAGPFGCGKTTCARMYARYINCKTLNACGKCESCLHLDDAHPDIVEINGADSRGIDDIRKLKDRARYLPRYNFRVIILDEIHQWTAQSAQAFLKPLEEPPKNTVYILGTTDPQKLLPAILSRVKRVNIVIPTKDQVMERLAYIAEKEKFKVKSEVIDACAEGSSGHMRDAVTLLETARLKMADDPKMRTKDLVNIISRTGSQEMARIAVKMLLGMYLEKEKVVAKAIFDTTEAIPLMNMALRMNEFLLVSHLYPDGTLPNGIWRSGDMMAFKAEADKYAKSVKLKHLLKVQSKLVACRSALQNFLVQERSLLLGMLC